MVHVGQPINAQVIVLSTTGDDNHFTRVTVNNAGPDGNGFSIGGGANPIFSGPAVSDTRTLSGTPTSAGVISGTITLATSGEGLAGESPVSVSVGYSVQVFSGTRPGMAAAARWAVPARMRTGPIRQLRDSCRPGRMGVAADAATLGAGIAGTITLDGPVSLGALTFNNSAAAYILTSGSGGTLDLNSGTVPVWQR